MTVLVSALAFFFLITGLILIHELGHFFMARKAGVEVEEFGFGLPPRAKTVFTWRGTAFTLNWIPFGGFVRLKGENGDDSERMAPGSFARASILSRSLILIAGVAMNFLLAFLIFLFGFSAGKWIPTYLSLEDMEAAADRGEINMDLGVLIDDVLAGGGAEDAGIAKGSLLVSIDGQPVERAEDVMRLQQGKSRVTYAYTSGMNSTGATLTTAVVVEEGKTGVYLRTVPVHVSAPARSFVDSVSLSARETGLVTSQTVVGIAKLFTSLAQRGQVPEGVTGIVGIAQLTYTSVQEGFMVYLRLVALLSLSLAVLNILPFPALDGGRLLFVLSEIFIKQGSRRVEIITNTVGFGILLFVILLVTLYDVFRLFL